MVYVTKKYGLKIKKYSKNYPLFSPRKKYNSEIIIEQGMIIDIVGDIHSIKKFYKKEGLN